MKKNKMMRIASVLLVAVLLSTCAISGTFAKYVTTSSGSDEARVAYWGWTAPVNMTIDLFDENYTNVESSESGVKVIAPGLAKETSFSFVYENYQDTKITAPEVAYSFVVTVDTGNSNTTQLDANPNFKWTLNGTQYNTLAELKTEIEKLDGDEEYAAGELPDNFDENQQHTIGWIWLFDETESGVNKDDQDTAMGNSQDLEHVYIKITITATQIDGEVIQTPSDDSAQG